MTRTTRLKVPTPLASTRSHAASATDAKHLGSDVLPVVRLASLVRLTPPPSGRQAQSIQASLASRWEEKKGDYRKVVAESAGLKPNELEFVEKEWVRCHYDGKTPMVDFPRLRTLAGTPLSFDTRICIALCTDKLSSKVWSRVGYPLRKASGDEEHPEHLHVTKDQLRSLTSQFRKIAESSSEWATRMLEALVAQKYPKLSWTQRGILEISALTVGDQNVGETLQELAHSETTAAALLARDDNGAELGEYLLGLANLDDASLLEITETEPDAFWFSTTGTVELADGHLVSRPMLFLMHPRGEVAQAIGIGFDDSTGGQLLRQSALTVSRWVANRV